MTEPSPMSESSSSTNSKSVSKFWDQIFPGLGIGLLMGLLVGLTTSAVVSGLLTTLGGLLAAILGLQGRGASEGGEGASVGPFSFLQVNSGRIGAFGLACAIGVLGGMAVRVKGLLDTPLKQQVGEWIEAGFDSTQARKFVAHANSTLRVGANGDVSDAPLTELQKQKMGVLFNALRDVDLCEKIKVSQFGSNPEESAEQLRTLYRRLDVGDTADIRTPLYRQMKKWAQRWEAFPAPTQVEIYLGVEEMVCAIQDFPSAK